MTTEEYLLQRYGPLMSLGDVARLLGRSPDGIRVALYSNTDVARKLKPTMLRVGRRVYFRTLQVKDALALDGSAQGVLAQ
ncbi:plasmid-related protein [Comamonas kerstersii]|uniref:plasmid-related protein n=1 Tax=Comamonas kerstersii TaxID=225992 RepID=UPI0026DDAA3E|nr:plasmid-related protein [Comamonas kerstersii]